MQAETSNRLYTYEDYLKLNDDNQYELIGGELIVVPAPKTIHQRLSHRLNRLLSDFVISNDIGEVMYAPIDVVLNENNKPQPDILYIAKHRLNIIKEKYIDGAPDLVVEILSPSTINRDRVEKSRLYYTHGVREYWLVDPDAGIVEVFTHGEKNWNLSGAYCKEEILSSPLLKGLKINLKNIFKGLIP